MAFRAVVVAAIVALASAGYDAEYMNYMNNMMHGGGGGMMGGMMNGGMMNGGMMNGGMMNGGGHQSGGCDPQNPSGGCHIPASIDVGEYLKQQMEQQQYESQQMAAKLKAQFEAVMANVTMRKHRHAMSVLTEYTSMCACLGQSYIIYQTMFVESAKAANLTDVVDLNEINYMPYEAKTAKEARELIFIGFVKAVCTAVKDFMDFAKEVENNIPIYQNNPVTTRP